MGQRANLVIVKNGEWRLYYDHWCANRLQIELFWGPELATEFIDQRPPLGNRNDWLDEVWCEGGAIVDHDRKILVWFGGEDIMYDIPARRAFIKLMQRQWLDWEIRWATGAIVELGAYVGIEATKFLTRNEPDAAEAIRVLTEYPDDNCMLLTVLQKKSAAAGRVFGDEESLEIGASQQAGLLTMATSSALTWTGSMPTAGLHLDADNRTICYWLARPAEDVEQRVQKGWHGWRTLWLRDQFEEHVRISSLDIRLPIRSNHDLQLEQIDSLRRCCHHAASNPARELGPRVGATNLNPWTDEARGSVGSQADKLNLLEDLKAKVLREPGFV